MLEKVIEILLYVSIVVYVISPVDGIPDVNRLFDVHKVAG